MDTGDTTVTGDFDLNIDSVNLRLPRSAATAAAGPRVVIPPPVEDDDDLLDPKTVS
jgi:hypothetical protein